MPEPYDATAFKQIQRDIDELFDRVKLAETAESPVQRALVTELHDIKRKVDLMDIEGTHITQVRLANIEAGLAELKEDAKSIRITVRSALLTAVLSIGGQLILFAILRGQ